MARDRDIQGKVAAILSSRELILNIGTEDGVEVGDRFVILNDKALEVADPDTLEILGAVEVPKTVVKVVRVGGPHLATARTFRTVPGTPGLFGGPSIAGRPAHVETLDVQSDSVLKNQLGEDLYVKPGDIARFTEGTEYDDQ